MTLYFITENQLKYSYTNYSVELLDHITLTHFEEHRLLGARHKVWSHLYSNAVQQTNSPNRSGIDVFFVFFFGAGEREVEVEVRISAKIYKRSKTGFHYTCCDENIFIESKSLLYSRNYPEACNEWRDPSPRLSVWTARGLRTLSSLVTRCDVIQRV